MRSFSALHFYLRIGIYFVAEVFAPLLKEKHTWYFTGLVSLSIALIIVIIRPYKLKYMNIVDTLLLMDYALLCFAMATGTMLRHRPIKFLIKTPVIIFILVIVVRILWQVSNKFCFHKQKLKTLIHRCCRCCRFGTSLFHNSSSTAVLTEAEQSLMQPTSTEIVID